MKKILSFLALVLVSVMLIGCTKDKKVTLSSIAVTTDGAKVQYNVGEQFSKEGLVVTATYSNKTTKNVTNFEVDSSKFNASVAGEYEIIVSYKEGDITKTATYKVKVAEIVADHLEINTDNATTVFVKGDAFSSEGITVSIVFSNGETGSYAGTDFVVDDSKYNAEVIGEYEITVTLEYEGKTLTGTYNVTVESNEVTITTVEQFLEMRTFVNADNVNPKIYRLGADLDLAGVTLDAPVGTFTGHFDGQGHTIKNATYVQTASKEGMLFKKVAGAVIENVKFFACTVVGGASETISMIAGECNEVGVTFNNIEFSCCTVDNGAQNYAALLVGRNESKTVEIVFNEITVKNMTSVKSKQYVGGLIGDVIKGSSVTANNCDIDITLSASNQISVFSGRNRGASVTVTNSVVRLTVGAATTTSTNQCGVFADGNAASTITATNVAILKFEMQGVYSIAADIIHGRNNNTAATTLTNVYYVPENATIKTVKPLEAGVLSEVAAADVTSEFLMTTVALGDKWEADTNKIVKLINSSANTPSADATVTSLVLVTGACDKLFFIGEAFNSDGLIVTAIYSDGCVVATTDYTVEILNSAQEVVTEAEFLTAPAGIYTIKVTSNGVSETYTIDLVTVSDITIDTSLVQTIFQVGDTFNANKLIVFRELTNGTHELVAAKDYQVTVDALAATGEYTVTVTYGEFEKTYIITVVDDQNVYLTEVTVVVDPNVATGTVNEGTYSFKTINEALDYLTSLKLDEQVIKTIVIEENIYEEKVTIDLPNVVLKGAGQSKSKITASNASGTVKPDETGTYGTDDSATVIVTANAYGFTAYNMFFDNSFDYNNSTLANKQALALRCDADMATFYQCSFHGYQDTLEAKTGRQYYYECEIEGAVDFIFGTNATAIFESCTIKALTRYDSKGEPDDNNGYVCAPKGFSRGSGTDTVTYNYVFMNCNFTASEDVLPGSMSVARPWGSDASVVTIKCSFDAAYAVNAYGGEEKPRYDQMSGNSPVDSKFYEYQNTGVGSITEEVAGMRFLTDEEAANYTIENIFAQVNGQVDYGTTWVVEKDPLTQVETRIVYYYTIGQTEYQFEADFVESTIDAFTLVGNKLSAYSISVLELTEVITNESGEVVDAQEITKTAGTYTIKLMNGDTVLEENTITVKPASTGEVEVTKTYTFDVANLDPTGVVDKDALEQAEIDAYFTVSGTVQKRLKSDGTAISSVEVGKACSSYIEFTITGNATVTLQMSSNGGSNTSAVGLMTTDGTVIANAEGITTITGSKATTMTYTLTAGTYRIVSPENAEFARVARLYTITVVETK